MAAVARELGPYSAMSLYRHVLSKDGMIDLMLDTVVDEIVVPSQPGPDWRADLHAVAAQTWAMVTRHVWYAQLVHTRPPLGPNTMRRTEFILQVLTLQGAGIAEAVTYAALLDRHIFGNALQEAEERAMQHRYGIENWHDVRDTIIAARDQSHAEGRYPNLARWMSSPSGATLDEQFELSLAFLLDGIATRLSPGSETRLG